MRACYLAIAGLFIIFLQKAALADAYPYSGYFSVNNVQADPKFMQAKCALAFFKQDADGVGRDYIIDLNEYKKTGHVQYLQVDQTTCVYHASKQSDSCEAEVYDKSGKSHSTNFDYILPITETGGDFYSFTGEKELENFISSPTKEIPDFGYISAQKMHLHRCVGFSDETVLKHVPNRLNDMTVEDTINLININPTEKDIPAILEVMQLIGIAAANATLPGQ